MQQGEVSRIPLPISTPDLSSLTLPSCGYGQDESCKPSGFSSWWVFRPLWGLSLGLHDECHICRSVKEAFIEHRRCLAQVQGML